MSLFSKPHYVFLASIFRDKAQKIKSSNDTAKKFHFDDFLISLSKALYSENPNFETTKFFENIYDPKNLQTETSEKFQLPPELLNKLN